jgi:hypothetical protein
MSRTMHGLNRINKLAIVAILSTFILACWVPLSPKAVKPPATAAPNLKTARPTPVPTHIPPTATKRVINLSTPKSPAKMTPTTLPTAVPDNTVSLYEGDFNGVKYSVIYPGDFSHSSAYGWEQFCLTKHDRLCVSVHPSNGSWNDAQAMADDVMGQRKTDPSLSSFTIYHQQSTNSSDGYPAYWVGSTYTYKGDAFESSSLFIVIQHIGFEIVADGEPQMMEAYRQILNSIISSFTVGI